MPKLCSCCLQYGLPSTNPYLSYGRCLLAPPLWNSITFVNFYKPPLSAFIQKMKFQGMTSLALVLTSLLLLRWRNLWRDGNIKKSVALSACLCISDVAVGADLIKAIY
ncbi:hypothetical protein [Candidatus Williamhamiltonella defendens]|uniref:hypothetical protein n=1 Tax=Candidatus Williamhamiltonella defendens TaxID=138072 RepID=UPI00387E433A